MATGTTSGFRPTGTIGLTAGTISTNVMLLGGGETVVVTNTATTLAYVRFGTDLTVAASNSDMPILPNSRILLSVSTLVSTASAVLTSGSGMVLFSRGDGSFL
jgi:hypothetical protein